MGYGFPMVQKTQQMKTPQVDHSARFPSGTEIESRPSILPIERTRAPAIARWQSLVLPTVLFLFGVALLLFRLGQHPNYAYNWESYTSWRFFTWWDNPSTSIFELNDGLMTDSGASPLIAPIVWVGFKALGVSILAMRLPVALVTALALPLTWVVGRRLVGDRAAVLAAVMLGLLPSFLIYGRTATNVGI